MRKNLFKHWRCTSMEFWNSDLTEKSWSILQDIQKEKFRFVLIGGWASYLWTKQHKSRDIDIIIPDYKELEILKKKYSLNKNDHLKKYEIKFGEVDIDIYLPHYSKLALPPEIALQHTTKIEGFEVVTSETLLILKQGAELDRKDSVKGQKDKIDIITLLLYANPNIKTYNILLKENNLEHYKQRLRTIITTFKEIQHVGLTRHTYARKKKELLKNIR